MEVKWILFLVSISCLCLHRSASTCSHMRLSPMPLDSTGRRLGTSGGLWCGTEDCDARTERAVPLAQINRTLTTQNHIYGGGFWGTICSNMHIGCGSLSIFLRGGRAGHWLNPQSFRIRRAEQRDARAGGPSLAALVLLCESPAGRAVVWVTSPGEDGTVRILKRSG